ncbi:hypothetical protein Trydic_g22046 [Trypoxylus dichotomus]
MGITRFDTSLLQVDTMNGIAEEINKHNIEILALQEMRWKGSGSIKQSKFTLYYSGSEHQEGAHPMPYSVEEILDIIKTLKNRKAPGRDGITNAAIKHLHLGAIDALRDIINGVLRYQHFPQTWKHAMVIVLHKTGKPKDSTDGYRPISLLPGLSKVLEKVIQRRLLEIVSQKEILPGFQFGFRQEHSTSHQLLRITEHVTEHLHRSTPTAPVMLDIEKAFDKVWHEGLVCKLRQYKFPAALTNLAQHYLKERTFAENLSDSIRRPAMLKRRIGPALTPATST